MGPISWETVETVSDLIFLGSKITTDGDCSHEIKRCLLLGRKVMTKLDIEKQIGRASCRERVADFIFLGSKIIGDGDCSHEIKRCSFLGSKVMTNIDSILKSRHYFANKGTSSQSYGFSSSHVWMLELDCEES